MIAWVCFSAKLSWCGKVCQRLQQINAPLRTCRRFTPPPPLTPTIGTRISGQHDLCSSWTLQPLETSAIHSAISPLSYTSLSLCYKVKIWVAGLMMNIATLDWILLEDFRGKPRPETEKCPTILILIARYKGFAKHLYSHPTKIKHNVCYFYVDITFLLQVCS